MKAINPFESECNDKNVVYASEFDIKMSDATRVILSLAAIATTLSAIFYL